jgi:hypothetical protein
MAADFRIYSPVGFGIVAANGSASVQAFPGNPRILTEACAERRRGFAAAAYASDVMVSPHAERSAAGIGHNLCGDGNRTQQRVPVSRAGGDLLTQGGENYFGLI